MSHFFVTVLIPGDTEAEEIENKVSNLLAPYDENNGQNPKWDWWRIGGRYDGRVLGNEVHEQRQIDGGFNWGEEHQNLAHNSKPVSKLPASFSCFAIVAPSGEWRERGKMGWFASVSDEKSEDKWLKELRSILKQHPDCLAVGCDLHI